ncbi:methylated-DNA-protein-cysteine methyltransferase [Vibrio variabilis]|uniref:Methylated-DNA-protein-cysteine methyltransferase n=1 Tax=Vibrio variabilis TaxID=990271 RepID=A0ABQ0J915_9VIBR|nr:methylated-DNA-protein-cysteine methyltransferase [Vibrio variabilis]
MPSELGHYQPEHPVLSDAATQLTEYLSGTRQQFSLPLAAKGTEFQSKVWEVLCSIRTGNRSAIKSLPIEWATQRR